MMTPLGLERGKPSENKPDADSAGYAKQPGLVGYVLCPKCDVRRWGTLLCLRTTNFGWAV